MSYYPGIEADGEYSVSESPIMPKDRNKLSLTVMSGRYDANLQGVEADFNSERDAGRDFIVSTEQGNANRTHILESDPQYGVIRFGNKGRKSEQVILFNQDEWTKVNARSIMLTEGGGHNSQRFPIYATLAVFTNGSRMVCVVAVHMPSHLTPGSNFYYPINPQLWYKALRRLSKEVTAVRRTYPKAQIILAGDWNAGVQLKWAYTAMVKAFPVFALGRGNMFGNAWTTRGLDAAGHRTLPSKGSDHDIERLNYTWK